MGRVTKCGAAVLAIGALAGGCSSPTARTSSSSSAACARALSPSCDTQTPSGILTGAGANSANTFFTRAFYDYNLANRGVSVNYAPSGSGVGITDIQQNTVRFGDSEIPMPVPATGTAGEIVQIPVDLGGVALSYNLPDAPDGLKLDGPTLAGIYLGTIKDWSSPAIAALNPGVRLAARPIVAVHRADSSGPGYDLDQYLIDAGGPAWTAAAGSKASTHWPAAIAQVGLGQQLNTGVAAYLQQTPGAIGYIEYAYARQAKFHSAALKNTAGSFVAPSTASIGAAGANAANLSAANFNIVNGPGAGTYPLANFSWTLLYRRQAVTATGIILGRLFDWISSTEQAQAGGLGYSPLPGNARSLAHTALLGLQDTTGKPLFS